MASPRRMAPVRFLPLALASLLLIVGCGGGEGGVPAPPAVGEPAPEYTAQTLEGGAFALSEQVGEVILLNVWATWCGPCVREMPKLQEIHLAYAEEGLTVLGVSIDRGAAEGEVRSFIDDHQLSFGILLDPDGTIETRFRTLGVPETFLIDRQGVLRHRWIGEFDPGAPEVRAQVEALLAETVS